MNIDEILKYTKPKESYYDLLGCSQSSSIDQINREYKIKALQLHPDKNPKPECVEQFKRIQSAKEILSDSSSRRLYDKWLYSGINIPFEQFQAKSKGHSMHWATPNRNAPLGIQGRSFQGQGSDIKMGGNINEGSRPMTMRMGLMVDSRGDAGNSLLDKFRKYEI